MLSSQKELQEVERFSLNGRIQHVVLFVSLVVLSLTGLTLKFHSNPVSRWLLSVEGEARGYVHRCAAAVLILLGVYHALYVTFSEKGHAELMELKPRGKDFLDFWQDIKFNLGLSGQLSQYAKFDYRQKFQYWAVTVGAVIMVLTGAALWLESAAMAVLPKWIMDLTIVIHGYQGVLIFIVLFAWHLYDVHLNPKVFPMDNSWLTGRISIKRLKEEHSLEYEKRFGEKD